MRYRLHEAAKARGKTLTEYLAGGPDRLMHIHEELAFDELSAMQEAATQYVVLSETERRRS
ncbi:MAG: hypothetical protein ACM3UP_00595 [Methanocella sp.]